LILGLRFFRWGILNVPVEGTRREWRGKVGDAPVFSSHVTFHGAKPLQKLSQLIKLLYWEDYYSYYGELWWYHCYRVMTNEEKKWEEEHNKCVLFLLVLHTSTLTVNGQKATTRYNWKELHKQLGMEKN
jgi:hypothetical protein